MTGTLHYIIIGAMKSGTTTMHEILSRYSKVSMSRFKEPNFFNIYYKKGLAWYGSLYPDEATITADASPNYAKSHQWPETAARMYHDFPNAKLIYIVRDPIERIASHLHHDIHRDRIKPEKCEAALWQDKEYIMTSSYAYQLQFYLRYFKRESILVIPFEWLRDRPEYFLQQISNFMNIDNVVLPDQRKYYAAESKYLIKRFDWAKRSLPPAVRKYYHAFFHLLAIKHPKPVLNENTKRELRARLQKDIDELKIICGYDFPEWKVYDAAGK